jgi:methyl-accepting chemotaxis protein
VALSEKTQAVGEIIGAVTDIAERSNLLALNAAIEAAGAGEHGTRFAVVASEMKNLADQAKESTVQVQSILGAIQKGINSSVMLTEEAVKRAEASKEQAETTERVIRQMADTTQESVRAFQQIIAATNQQQIGLDQVTQGMKDIRQAAGQTASASSQLEKAVANVNALSQQLQRAIGRYRM